MGYGQDEWSPTEEERQRVHELLADARRQLHRPPRWKERNDSGEPDLSNEIETLRIAYEMELAEHRSTTDRLHRAQLADRDSRIEALQNQIAGLLEERERLRVALQVLTGRQVPDPIDDPEIQDSGATPL